MSEAAIMEAALEVLIERKPRPKLNLLDPNFPNQMNFIRDSAKRKALFCTRRSAKSYTGGLHLVETAEKFDGCNCLYIGLTRGSAKGIIWKDILKEINTKHDLGLTFNGSELTATTRGGSVIYVTGVDADADEMQKLLGKKWKLVIIDEAASFTIDLRELIYGILGPACVDQGGTICLLGTSGNLTKGLFFDITNGKEAGWKLYQWTAHDNPYISKQWQEELDDIAKNRPMFMDTPLFKQWYLNQWVIDDDQLVYRFSYNRNLFDNLPTYRVGGWQYVLGVDLGYSPDPSAFVLVCFHEHDPSLYVIETFKQTEMDITDVAQKIKAYQKEYEIFRVVIDGANKQAVEEMQRRHGIALTTADKTGKVDFIQIMNAEMIQAKIKLAKHCQDLTDEYMGLIWDERAYERTGKRQEHSSCANHLTDAALYAWRFCYQWLSQPAKEPVNLRARDQYIKHTQSMMEDALERQIKQQEASEREADIWALSEMGIDDNPLQYYVNKRKS